MDQTYDCTHVVDIAEEPRHHLIIANDYIRAFAVEIPPHDRTLCHRHPHDYLLYVASGAKIISAARDEEPKRLSYNDGECELSPAGLMHVVDNLGDTPFRNVVVELQPRAATLRRGAPPKPISGVARIEQLLAEDAGVIYSIAVAAAAEVEIDGPAVLSAPHDRGFMVKEIEDFDTALDDFRKLMWICAPRKVWVRNSGDTLARMIVFQLGSPATRVQTP
jgi:quercetin dioxygenase-like cupin family protein